MILTHRTHKLTGEQDIIPITTTDEAREFVEELLSDAYFLGFSFVMSRTKYEEVIDVVLEDVGKPTSEELFEQSLYALLISHSVIYQRDQAVPTGHLHWRYYLNTFGVPYQGIGISSNYVTFAEIAWGMWLGDFTAPRLIVEAVELARTRLRDGREGVRNKILDWIDATTRLEEMRSYPPDSNR